MYSQFQRLLFTPVKVQCKLISRFFGMCKQNRNCWKTMKEKLKSYTFLAVNILCRNMYPIDYGEVPFVIKYEIHQMQLNLSFPVRSSISFRCQALGDTEITCNSYTALPH